MNAVKQVTKRDSQIVEFDKNKIINAIEKAMNRTENGVSEELSNKIADSIASMEVNNLSIEEIQEIVENKLMSSSRKDVAKEYIRYRYKRQEERSAEINLDNEIQGLFDMTSEEVRNNANKAGDKLQSYKAMVSDITSKDYAMRRIIPERFKKEHERSIYWHDLNYEPYPIWNCTLINWMDMLDNGFNINGVDIETPKSIETAVALLSQIVAHVSSNCFGGVTLGQLSHLSKYGKKSLDKHKLIGAEEGVSDVEGYAWRRLEKEIYDACQGLEYEIQTLTNARAEVPFLTIELDACDDYTNEEDRRIKKMIISSYLKVRTDGLTGGKTAVFPKLTFQLKKGVNLNPEDPDYDLFKQAIRCSSRRLYPDFLNYDKLVEVTGGYKPPMGQESAHVKPCELCA